MDNYVAPEIPGYAKTIINNTLGTKTELQSVEWSAGGLFNKVFYIHTPERCFILKIECEKIFPSTRTGQIENEVEGIRLFTKAGIPCSKVLAHDFTGNDIGVRYIFTECISGDIVLADFEQMDESTKAEVEHQSREICNRMTAIKHTHFGSLIPTGSLGWHKTWSECYRAWFNLLINDGVNIGLFTDDELSIIRTAANMPLVSQLTYEPSFEHGDLGWHNMVYGNTGGGLNKLYTIDFGNARYVPPHLTLWGEPPNKVPNAQILDKDINLLLLYDFEMSVMWKEMQKLTNDYAHCMSWMTNSIEQAKKDTSRDQITAFVEKCRNIVK
ncbi:MAG: aminoglycoside phosphotransferase family protein [Oscillospiraceae bacterium]|nr:aminoglycoside phosphotransferase family protein [Oscillospiraceae bacterium]